MEKIKKYTDQIKKELDCAKYYASHHAQAKTDNDHEWSERTKLMAEDELRHAKILHERATMEIEKLKDHYKPTAEMQDAWDNTHREYVKLYEWVKEQLN